MHCENENLTKGHLFGTINFIITNFSNDNFHCERYNDDYEIQKENILHPLPH